MKIVVDIPEGYYKELHKSVYVQSRGNGKSFLVPLIMAVQNGTPLSEYCDHCTGDKAETEDD